MLDDPSITKIYFERFNEMIEVEVDKDEMSRLACIIRKPSGYYSLDPKGQWHVEIIDCAGGVYTVKSKISEVPKKIWFETKLRKSYLKKNKGNHVKGRYD